MINLDYDAVIRSTGVTDLIEPLRRAFGSPTFTPERHHHELDPEGQRTLLLMPAWQSQAGLGVKISTVFNDNPSRGWPAISGLYVLLSAQNGSVLAVIDGRALTLLRTAAVSALAAGLLAPLLAESLLMVGTGALSTFLVEGHASVRSYRRISVWGRSLDKAIQVVRRLRAAGVEAHAVDNLETAARSADVISCATYAREPLVRGAWLKPEAHLDLVGGYKPQMLEADENCLRNARVVVDSPDALRDAGDLVGPLERNVLSASQIEVLGAALAKSPGPKGRTVFKAIGTGLADLAAAEQILLRHRFTA